MFRLDSWLLVAIHCESQSSYGYLALLWIPVIINYHCTWDKKISAELAKSNEHSLATELHGYYYQSRGLGDILDWVVSKGVAHTQQAVCPRWLISFFREAYINIIATPVRYTCKNVHHLCQALHTQHKHKLVCTDINIMCTQSAFLIIHIHTEPHTHVHTQKTYTCISMLTHKYYDQALTWLPASVFSVLRAVCRSTTRPHPPRWLSAGTPSSPAPRSPSQIYSTLRRKVQVLKYYFHPSLGIS